MQERETPPPATAQGPTIVVGFDGPRVKIKFGVVVDEIDMDWREALGLAELILKGARAAAPGMGAERASPIILPPGLPGLPS